MELEVNTWYGELKKALFSTNQPDSSWPRSSRNFRKRFESIWREISSYLVRTQGWKLDRRENQGQVYFTLEPA